MVSGLAFKTQPQLTFEQLEEVRPGSVPRWQEKLRLVASDVVSVSITGKYGSKLVVTFLCVRLL